jgi:very-short-patch-repair endonuclease
VGGAELATERKSRESDTRIPRARKLRRGMTTAERKLWWHLRRVAPARSHFRRQATIGPYFADFACHDLRLVIELDGGQHGRADQMLADTVRTEFLSSRGYRVLRFWNNDVLTNIDGVLTVIQSALDDAAGSHPPPPTPPRHARGAWREGRKKKPHHASRHPRSFPWSTPARGARRLRRRRGDPRNYPAAAAGRCPSPCRHRRD